MSVAIPLRRDFDASQLRGLARKTKDGPQARRLLALAAIYDGAKRTEAVGLHDGALRLRLAAPPIEGRANEALIAWLADQLGVPRKAVELLRGASSRRKQVALPLDAAAVASWLDRIVPPV